MGVSSETIRKGPGVSGQPGRLVQGHGGAVPDSGKPGGYSGGDTFPSDPQLPEPGAKAAITAKAAGLVSEGQVIALDYGSTSQMMALVLKERFRNLTVVTNSIQNALMLARESRHYHHSHRRYSEPDEYTLVNEFSSTLESIHIDIMFMTVTGLTLSSDVRTRG